MTRVARRKGRGLRGRARRAGVAGARERGAIFGMVLLTALAVSISAYGALLVASSQAQYNRLARQRLRARHVGEAALVFTREQLWTDPRYCGGFASLITDGVTGAVTPVNIVVTDCGAGNESRPHRITATVSY